MYPPPGSGGQHAAGMANAAHAAHAHDRLHSAENMAELKAIRGSRFALLRRLLNLVTRRNG
jgi:hypothetical protein